MVPHHVGALTFTGAPTFTAAASPNGPNDAEMFLETFEAFALVGPASQSTHLTVTTCPAGASTIPNHDASGICAGR